jgi:hypothetical protein
MVVKKILARSGAVVALVLALSAVASAKPAPVTIRIEGRAHTLVPRTAVFAHGGVVRKGAHSCAAASGAGALNGVTHGHWSGQWFSGLGFEVYTILGETDKFTSTKSFWELFVNNVAATSGMCSVKLHPGEHLLFAAVPASGIEYPLGLTVPSHPVAGRSFNVRVVFYNARGKAKPLAGARVNGVLTNAHGVAKIGAAHTGRLVLKATHAGYIRYAVPVQVSP